jgi:hypothetical protein
MRMCVLMMARISYMLMGVRVLASSLHTAVRHKCSSRFRKMEDAWKCMVLLVACSCSGDLCKNELSCELYVTPT